MEKLKTETILNSFKQLEDIVRCAVCLEVVRLDMVQCVNSHLLCSECKADLKKCPTCRAAFSPDKPSGFHTQVVEALPRRCKHKNCGSYLNTDDDHETYCGYRVTLCKNCEWTGPGKDLLKHVTDCRSRESMFTEQDSSFKCTFFHGLKKNVVTHSPFSAHNTFLWKKLSLNVNTKKLFITFYCVPNGKPSKNLFFKLKIDSKQSNFFSKMKLTLDPEVDDEDNRVYIPWKILRESMNERKKLHYEVYITEE